MSTPRSHAAMWAFPSTARRVVGSWFSSGVERNVYAAGVCLLIYLSCELHTINVDACERFAFLECDWRYANERKFVCRIASNASLTYGACSWYAAARRLALDWWRRRGAIGRRGAAEITRLAPTEKGQ